MEQAKEESNNNLEVSTARRAYDLIKERILRNEFPPNEFISIGSLAEMIGGMGFTPVREAVQRLSEEQFLNLIPRKGIVVPEFDLKTIMDILELRFVVEKYATVRAAGKISEEQLREAEASLEAMREEGKGNFEVVASDYAFHLKIIEVMGNKQFIRILSHLYDHSIRFNLYFLAENVRSEQTYKEHLGILKAIREGDLDKVEEAITIHQKGTRQLLLDSMLFTME